MDIMDKYRQPLNGGWYAAPEGKDLRVPTSLPALVKDLFPSETGPVLFYNEFDCDLCGDAEDKIVLCFDKVVCGCEVWLNSVFIGSHVHSEQRFEFDVTDHIRSKDNRLVLRVEGIDSKRMPNFGQVYGYYTVIPMTGVYGEVCLIKKPRFGITDLYVVPDLDSKTLSVELTLENSGDRRDAKAEYRIFDGGDLIITAFETVSLKEYGRTSLKQSFAFDDVKPWSPDNPHLYDIAVSVSSDGKTDILKKRFGFKSFLVKDGWFYLNGRRIFLTCAHCVETREAVVHARTMGFKALRYLTAMPSEEILDFCDETGMLVYEECAAAWGMQDYPNAPKDLAAYLDNMLIRDRSHVCVGIWGIFNEQAGPNALMKSRRIGETTGIFDFAVYYLPRMRRLDDTRLILLSSGRWDARADIGSYSNPHSAKWEHGWGREGEGGTGVPFVKSSPDVDPYISGLGDVHLYPTVPIQNRVRDFIRNIGADSNPVFLSEYGVGYQLELYDLSIEANKNLHRDHPMHNYYDVQISALEAWIEKYSLQNVYPTPRGFLWASIEAGARQRRLSIDAVRSNPRFCGYSLTSFSVGNEGVYFRNGAFVPGIADALRDSFAPLKWSVFMDSVNLYENDDFGIEVVLCSEDALEPGTHTALVSVSGKDGVVFRDEIDFEYPEDRPLAASVFNVRPGGLPGGEYSFYVELKGAVQPACGTKTFRVYSSGSLPKLSGLFLCVGDTGAIAEFLVKNGMEEAKSLEDSDVIVVCSQIANDLFRDLLDMARAGKRIVLLDPRVGDGSDPASQEFMESVGSGGNAGSSFGKCVYVRNWLYHMDNYISDDGPFNGIAGVGIVDMELFSEVYPDHYLTDTAVPLRTCCAAFGSGLFAEDNCIAALTMGEFGFGRGRVFVSTFKLTENVGRSPVADRMLYNIIGGL